MSRTPKITTTATAAPSIAAPTPTFADLLKVGRENGSFGLNYGLYNVIGIFNTDSNADTCPAPNSSSANRCGQHVSRDRGRNARKFLQVIESYRIDQYELIKPILECMFYELVCHNEQHKQMRDVIVRTWYQELSDFAERYATLLRPMEDSKKDLSMSATKDPVEAKSSLFRGCTTL